MKVSTIRRIQAGLAALAFWGFGLPVMAQQTITGYVYEDANNNQRKERREKGVANVGVSNGEDVVVTDAQGRYSISLKDGQSVFVIKPSGYRFASDSFHIPRFYYHYRPTGSPAQFQYKGIEPSGTLPRELNFAIYRQEEPADFSAVIFGDPQPYSMDDINAFSNKIVADVVKKPNTLFGISLGDIVGDNLDYHPIYKQRMQPLGLTWYNVMGNHDMNYDAKSDDLSDETFEKNFGSANYAFNYANAHFIILDNILYPDPRDGSGYWGGYRPDQLNFLENNLKLVPKNKLVVVSQHIPLDDTTGNAFRQEDKRKFFDLLKDFENVVVLSAHTHYQEQMMHTARQGWNGARPLHEYNVGTTSGDWYSGIKDAQENPDATMRDGTPQGYAFLNVKDNQYSFDYKVAQKPADYQMNIYAPRVVPHNGRTTSQIYVNFFMGSPGDLVEYRIGNGEWRKMNRVVTEDPSYSMKLIEWDLTDTLLPGRRPSMAVNSSHLWTGRLQLDLPPGEHTIEVRATDRYGKMHLGRKRYRVLNTQ